MNSRDALTQLWQLGALPAEALSHVQLTGEDPIFPSSFAVGTAAQSSVAAAALAACELGYLRGQARQEVEVDILDAALECTGWFSVDGKTPNIWDKFSGLYRCSDGWVRIHANFAHHRDGALKLLHLSADTAERADVERALQGWRALDFEQAGADHGLVIAALRTFEEWDQLPQARAVAVQPLISFERIGEAEPLLMPLIRETQRPLTGVKVLDLTRILAGPICGRDLAAYGADVMLVNSPQLPNIESIADTSRGKLSAHVDLASNGGPAELARLLAYAHVFVQGYRPGALEELGFGPEAVARRRPGIVYVSLSAYGSTGPWKDRRGFDSLVQSAMGFNYDEARAAGKAEPKAMPMQIIDYATGHLMAFATTAALLRQQREGGSWHVRLSLAQTGHWIRHLGRLVGAFGIAMPERGEHVEASDSGFGKLLAMKHAARLSRTPALWSRPSVPPGTNAPLWQ